MITKAEWRRAEERCGRFMQNVRDGNIIKSVKTMGGNDCI
jgi:hypothetical protein